MKLSADHNLVKNAIDEIEKELDGKIQNQFSNKNDKRPLVQSSRLDLESIAQERKNHVLNRIQNE